MPWLDTLPTTDGAVKDLFESPEYANRIRHIRDGKIASRLVVGVLINGHTMSELSTHKRRDVIAASMSAGRPGILTVVHHILDEAGDPVRKRRGSMWATAGQAKYVPGLNNWVEAVDTNVDTMNIEWGQSTIFDIAYDLGQLRTASDPYIDDEARSYMEVVANRQATANDIAHPLMRRILTDFETSTTEARIA